MNVIELEKPTPVVLAREPQGYISSRYNLAVGQTLYVQAIVGLCYAVTDDSGNEGVIHQDYFHPVTTEPVPS